MVDVLTEQKKRNTAFRLRIGDIKRGKPEIIEDRFLFLDIDGKKVIRVNLIANVIEKNIFEGEKKYANVVLDDASGQIRMKLFGEEISLFKSLVEGDTIQVIGILRNYGNEIYIYPEIIKKVDPRWLLARKLELQKEQKTEGNDSLREKILEKIKEAEKDGGIESEKLITELDASPSSISKEITKLLEEGLIYEPRPGKLRYLG